MSEITVSYKGNTITTMDASGTKTLLTEGKYCEDDITVVYDRPSGGGGLPTAENNDVNYIDYDGTIRYSYSKAEFANLSAHPANPSHEGLTAQGWNWTLSDAKTFVAKYGVLDIGQLYTTSDGATKFYVDVRGTDLAPTATINFKQSVANGVTVDWGDGSATETYSGTSRAKHTHNYAADGSYVISLKVTSGTLTLEGAWNENIMGTAPNNNYWTNSAVLRRVAVGSSTVFGAYAFYTLRTLYAVSIPSTLTSISGASIFQNSGVEAFVVPSGATIGGSNFFASAPMKRLSLPKNVTYHSNGLASLGNEFERVVLPGAVVLSSSSNVQANYATEILLTEDFTGTSIPSVCFQNCGCISRFTIPATVTSIGANAFLRDNRIMEYHILPTSVPTLDNTNAFSGINENCKMYVPYSADHSVLNAYKTASNWSTYASYMEEEPQ